MQARHQFVQSGALAEVPGLMAKGEYARALAVLLPVVQSAKLCALSLECTIICYSQLADDTTAWALSDLGCNQFPQAAGLWAVRARLAAEAGKTEAAVEAAETALALDGGHLPALVELNRVAPFEKGSKRDKQLRRVLKKSGHSAVARAEGHRALAAIEQRAQYYTRAFHHFSQSNRYQAGGYDAAEDIAFVMAQRAHFKASQETAVARYLFIGGMPRSGTTLLETALLRHPGVRSVGETSCLPILQKRLGLGDAAFDWCTARSESLRVALREELIEALDRGREGVQLVLEKLPFGMFHYGLAQWLLPEARFVVMMRHPMACGLSNYQANFQKGYGYATRLEHIAGKYLCVQASALDYAEKMPDVLRLQSYRALVETPEAELRSVCTLAGLSWDAAVLSPENAEHVQRTHSMLQVREGINRKGLERWRHYKAQLAPLQTALGGESFVSGWEAWDAQTNLRGEGLGISDRP